MKKLLIHIAKLAAAILTFFVSTFFLLIIGGLTFPKGIDGIVTLPSGYAVFILVASGTLSILVYKFTFRMKTIDIDLDEMFKPDTHTEEEIDSLVDRAAEVVFETGQASISMLQRKLNLGYSTAARIIDQLESVGVIGPFNGSVPREVLITKAEFETKKCIAQSPSNDSSKFSVDSQAELDFHKYGGVDAELLTIDLMEGHEFEFWCASLLEKLGYTDVEVTPGSGDQGVDVLAKKDGIKYAVQCKCYSSDLGNKPIQEVHAGKAMYGCHVGAVMTNRHFTAGGRQLAEATGVLLWDRDWISDALKMTSA